MNHEMIFFGNHNLDFKNKDIENLERYVIAELQKIPIPEKILDKLENDLISMYLGKDLSLFVGINKWSSVSFPKILGVRDFPKVNILTIGPMCTRLVITPHNISLPEIYYYPEDWYSPENIELVNIIRSYYYSIIKHFGGDHALYTKENLWQKYYNGDIKVDGSVLLGFEETLRTKYGENTKPLHSYKKSKLPKYFIDDFTDISI